MLKKILLLAFVSILLFSCASTDNNKDEDVVGFTLDSVSESNGNLYVENESGINVILYVNGQAYKRIPSKFGEGFRAKLTNEMEVNNNETVQIGLYPETIVEESNYELTADNVDQYIYNLQVRANLDLEYTINPEMVDFALSSRKEGNLTTQEFIAYLPSNAKSYLVELYTDPECTVRFARGAVMPGETLNIFKNPEVMTEVTVYAKYIRNDGKGTEVIAKGQVGSPMVIRGDTEYIDLPADPEDLWDHTIYGEAGRLSNTATLVIENTLPIDPRTNNIIVVNVGSDNNRIERHNDLQNSERNISYIEPKTTIKYVMNVGGAKKTYRLFIKSLSTSEIIKILDVELLPGEEYYLSFPGVMPSGIDSADIELKGSELERNLTIITNVPGVNISYEVTSTDTGLLEESFGDTYLGKTDNTNRPMLQTRFTLPLKGLTYTNSASAKITIKAEKEGYFPQTKSINVQRFLESTRGINLDPFVMEETSF